MTWMVSAVAAAPLKLSKTFAMATVQSRLSPALYWVLIIGMFTMNCLLVPAPGIVIPAIVTELTITPFLDMLTIRSSVEALPWLARVATKLALVAIAPFMGPEAKLIGCPLEVIPLTGENDSATGTGPGVVLRVWGFTIAAGSVLK